MGATTTSYTLSVHGGSRVAIGEKVRAGWSRRLEAARARLSFQGQDRRHRDSPKQGSSGHRRWDPISKPLTLVHGHNESSSNPPFMHSKVNDGLNCLETRQGKRPIVMPSHDQAGSHSDDQARNQLGIHAKQKFLAHQAAPSALQAAPPTPAHQAASAHQAALPTIIMAASCSPNVRNANQEPHRTRHRSGRAVFMPRTLRDHESLWRSAAGINGWLESPDLGSSPPPRGPASHKFNGDSDTVQQVNLLTNSAEEAASLAWLDEVPKSSRGDAALERARERNVRRLREATMKDCQILSKYMPSEISVFFPFGLVGPDDYFRPSQSWVEEVIKVAKTECTVPGRPQVRLGLEQEDLEHNTLFLAHCDWDMREVYRRHVGTTVDHGSEFRPLEQLQRVVGQHPGFAYLKEMFTSGFDYHLTRVLTEQERETELKAQLERGNHRSAVQNIDEIRALLGGDVRRGFVLPFRADAILKVKGLHLQPGGMVRQLSLKADGSRQPKGRFTHDLSFSITTKDASVNARVDMSKHPEMVYGWCLLRIIHYLAALRVRHPGSRIFISKFDYSDAYKRISQSPGASAASVIRFGEVAYICWRMVFGGSPNPAGFSGFSEMLTDLANEIAMSSYSPEDYWSPTVKASHLEVRETEMEDSDFAEAIMPAFEVPTSSTSFRDCFIDDIIDCHLDTEENRGRAGHIVQMAVHVMSRPHAGEDREPVPRKPLLGPDKLEAEGRSSERQIVLGWEIRTRDLKVALPNDKHIAWREDLVKMIGAAKASRKELESMIGRLNHASFVIPLSRHFLNEIRGKCERTPSHHRGRQTVRLNEHEIADLRLWLEFLDQARRGISINLLTVRTPTRLAWSDSCPFGLGGYSLQGSAWRIRVPRDCPFYGDDTANNVLEFLGMAISVLLLLNEAATAKENHPCILVLGDNTSAVSWIFRSGRVSRSSRYYPAVKFIARTIASRALQNGAQICSQHLAGVTNVVADLLSFEGDCRGATNPITVDCPPDDVLTERVHQFYSQVVPSGFQIRRLPDEIESFALSAMQLVANSWIRKAKQPSRKMTGTGGDGCASSASGEWSTTPSSIRFPATRSDCSWQGGMCPTIAPLTSTHREKLLQSVRNPWYRRLFETPLAVWHRRSGNVEGPAPSTSRTESMKQGRYTQEYD